MMWLLAWLGGIAVVVMFFLGKGRMERQMQDRECNCKREEE